MMANYEKKATVLNVMRLNFRSFINQMYNLQSSVLSSTKLLSIHPKISILPIPHLSTSPFNHFAPRALLAKFLPIWPQKLIHYPNYKKNQFRAKLTNVNVHLHLPALQSFQHAKWDDWRVKLISRDGKNSILSS